MVKQCEERCLHRNVCGVKEKFEEAVLESIRLEDETPMFKFTVQCMEFSHSRAKQSKEKKKEVEKDVWF